ncbi:hypothetical protein BH11PAT1_BH11PAT1_3120 [soil metagenome]
MKKNWLFMISSTAQKGQVLLIVVLVMVVALTIGLSVATRSITNLRTTTEEDNSQRAFSAAEAGIEQALKTNTGISTVKQLGNNASIKNVQVADLQPLGGSAFLLRNTAIEKNIGYDVWFVPHSAAGVPIYTTPWAGSTVTFYWGASNADVCTRAALEIIFITGTVANPTTVHQVFDPCPSHNNQFTLPNANFTTSTGTYLDPSTNVLNLYNKVVISGISNLLVARVTPLYADALIAIQAASLPSQGSLITSTGESGETFRKIQVNNPYPQVPAELYSVLFAPGN